MKKAYAQEVKEFEELNEQYKKENPPEMYSKTFKNHSVGDAAVQVNV